MKNLLLIALALFTFTSHAQNRQDFKNNQKLSAEQRAVLQTKRMTLLLDLDKGQQEEILILNKNRTEKQKKGVEKRKQRKGSNQKLTSNETFNNRSNRLDNSIAYSKSMKSILNKEQYEIWKRNRAKQQHKRTKKRKEQLDKK